MTKFRRQESYFNQCVLDLPCGWNRRVDAKHPPTEMRGRFKIDQCVIEKNDILPGGAAQFFELCEDCGIRLLQTEDMRSDPELQVFIGRKSS